MKLSIVPIELWFLIGLYTQKYSTYLKLAIIIPKLNELSKYARMYLTEYKKSQFYEEWTLDGKFHREECDENGYTLPAIIYTTGQCWWYFNGVRHRNERDKDGTLLPAFVGIYGEKEWYIDGEFIDRKIDKFLLLL